MNAPSPIVTPRIVALLLATGCAGSATAADGDHRAWLQLGAYRPSVDSSARIDDSAAGTIGTLIDFESDLGLTKSKTLPQLLAGVRLGERWRAEFEVFVLNRSASRTLDRDIVVDDVTYRTSGVVDSKLDSTIYRASVGYSLLRSEAAEAGVVLGLHVTQFDLLLEGEGTVNGGGVSRRREERDATVPLPTIGVYGRYAFSPSWRVEGRAAVFSLDHRGYDGRLVDVQASVVWSATRNVGVGLGYRYDDYRLTATRGDFAGRVEYDFRGPLVFVEAGF